MALAIVPQSVLTKAQIYGAPHLHTDGDILALRFTSKGTLWSVEDPGVVRQWDVNTGQPVRYHTLSDLEMVWAFSSDAQVLASGGDDLSLWETQEGNVLGAVSQESWVTTLVFHPSDKFLATGHDEGTVRLWNVKNLQCLREYRFHQEPISALSFSSDGNYLTSAAEDKLIALWDVDAGSHLGTFEGHTDRIPYLAWHPSGKTLVSAGWDTTARIWDTTAFEPIILLNSHASQVYCLAFTKDGQWLACADSANEVHIWNYADRKTLHVLRDNDTEIRHMAFSPDSKLLACGGEGVIYLWDPLQGKVPNGEQAQGTQQICMSLSPEGKRIAVNGPSGLRIWDTEARKSLFLLEEEMPVHVLAYSSDSRWIAGGTDSHIRIWEAESGTPRGLCEGPQVPITSLAFTPDGKILAASGKAGVDIWLFQVDDGEPFLLIPDPLNNSTIFDLAFHPEGRLLAIAGINQLATSGSTGGISVWDIFNRKKVVEIPGGCTQLAFDKTGQQLACATVDRSIGIWDFSKQEQVKELTGHDEAINALAYSPDGKWLVSGSDDLTLRFWDTATWSETAVRQIDSQIKHLAFSPDGQYLFAGNENLTCYRLEVAKLLAEE